MSRYHYLTRHLNGLIIASIGARFPYGEWPKLFTGSYPDDADFWRNILEKEASAGGLEEHLLSECVEVVVDDAPGAYEGWDCYGRLHRPVTKAT